MGRPSLVIISKQSRKTNSSPTLPCSPILPTRSRSSHSWLLSSTAITTFPPPPLPTRGMDHRRTTTSWRTPAWKPMSSTTAYIWNSVRATHLIHSIKTVCITTGRKTITSVPWGSTWNASGRPGERPQADMSPKAHAIGRRTAMDAHSVAGVTRQRRTGASQRSTTS